MALALHRTLAHALRTTSSPSVRRLATFLLVFFAAPLAAGPARAQGSAVFAEGRWVAALVQLADGRLLVGEGNVGAVQVAAYAADGTRLGTFADGFVYAQDVVQLADGRVLVADGTPYAQGRVKAFAADGTPLGTFAETTSQGYFNPGRLTQLSDGRVLVTDDSFSGRWVWAFAADGTLLGTFADTRRPKDVAEHADGRVLIAESVPGTNFDSSRVSAFAPNGTRLGTFASGFHTASRVDVIQDGRVLVAGSDGSRYDRVWEFAADGTPWGAFAEGLYYPAGATQLTDGRVLVAEAGQVVAYASDGTAQGAIIGGLLSPAFLTQLTDGRVLVANQHFVSVLAADGTLAGSFAAGQYFDEVNAVAELADGRVLVGEYYGNRVRAFGADGTPMGAFAEGVSFPNGIAQLADGRVLVVSAGQVLAFGADGSPQGVFAGGLSQPHGITQLTDGRVLVTESVVQPGTWPGRVWEFSPDGTESGIFAEGLDGPLGIVQLSDGRVLVAELGSQVRVFAPDGAFLGALATEFGAIGLAQLTDGRLLVTMRAHPDQLHSMQVWVFDEITVAVEPPAPAAGLTLGPTFPNPFGAAGTTISYSLAEAESVRLSVYDALGREVAVLAAGPHAAGQHTAMLAPTLANGVYVIRLVGAGQLVSRRITVMR